KTPMNSGEVQPMAPERRNILDTSRAPTPSPGNRHCTAIVRATGALCTARPLAGSPHCYMHSKNSVVAAQRHLARVQGGLRTNRAANEALAKALPPADLASAEGIRQLLQNAADAVRDGRIAPSVANSLAQLAGVSLRLVEL